MTISRIQSSAVILICILIASGCVRTDEKLFEEVIPFRVGTECSEGCADVAKVPAEHAKPLSAAIVEWWNQASRELPQEDNFSTWLTVLYAAGTVTDIRKVKEEQVRPVFRLDAVASAPKLRRWNTLPLVSEIHGTEVPMKMYRILSNMAYSLEPERRAGIVTRDVLRWGISEVVLSYQLNANGKPVKIEEVSNWSEEPSITEYAMRLLEGWRFYPERIDGNALTDKRYTIRFCIDSRQSSRHCSRQPLPPAKTDPGMYLQGPPWPTPTLTPPDGIN